MVLNIENLKCTMLIGAVGIDSRVLEIATGLKALAMTAGDGGTLSPGEGLCAFGAKSSWRCLLNGKTES